SISTDDLVRKFLLLLRSILPCLFHAKGDPKDPPQPKIVIFITDNYLF